MNDFDRAKLNRPPVFPNAWGIASGIDSFGYWQAFEIAGVRQVMRWIPPGEFVCGSPLDEKEREPFGYDETQHTVRLSEGFWLAESACTEALWRAVTTENPSRCKGDDLPVERVSFEQCEGFIEQLNQQLQPLGLQCTLPSEWQWEYAARAGTTTPFWWGESADRSQANFDSRHPDDEGEKGERSESPHEVLSYAPNPVGLYQVHGNVWEWTRTWESAYPVKREELYLLHVAALAGLSGLSGLEQSEPLEDPIGPISGRKRVLRGGSWINLRRGVRSANRDALRPSEQNGGVGLRLAGSDQ